MWGIITMVMEPQPAIFVGVLLIVAVPYVILLYLLPRLAMVSILKRFASLAGGFNKVYHYDNPTHVNRNIPAPCPDFLYSVVPLDFGVVSSNTVFHYVGPVDCEYACLGIYDDAGICRELVNHSGKSLSAVVVGPKVIASDEEILASSSHSQSKPQQVIRIPTTIALLLQRTISPFPLDAQTAKHKQRTITVTSQELKSLTVNASISTSKSYWFAVAVCYLLFCVSIGVQQVVHGLTLSELNEMGIVNGMIKLIPSLFFLLVIAVIAAVTTVIAMKNRLLFSLMDMMEQTRLGHWMFFGLKLKASTGKESPLQFIIDVFGLVYYFLHGALGLLGTEVVYGIAQRDSDGKLLEYGQNYVITFPGSKLRCQWWSVTLYGFDSLLVANDAQIYSINSFQLPTSSSSEPSFRIICSATKPEDNDCLWLPLPTLRESNAVLERDYKKSWKELISDWLVFAKHPYFTLRVYKPEGSNWLKSTNSEDMPIISKIPTACTTG